MADKGGEFPTAAEAARMTEAARRGAELASKWAAWCKRLQDLDRAAVGAWAEYFALLEEARAIRLSPWAAQAPRLDIPPEMAALRAGQGAIKWRYRGC